MDTSRSLGAPIRPFRSEHVHITRNGRMTMFGWSSEFTEWRVIIRGPDGVEAVYQPERYQAIFDKMLHVCSQEAGDTPIVVRLSPVAVAQLRFTIGLFKPHAVRRHTITTVHTPRGEVPVVHVQHQSYVVVDWKDTPDDSGTDPQRLLVAAIEISPAYCGISCVIDA